MRKGELRWFLKNQKSGAALGCVFLVILMIPFIYEKNENLEIFGCV